MTKPDGFDEEEFQKSLKKPLVKVSKHPIRIHLAFDFPISRLVDSPQPIPKLTRSNNKSPYPQSPSFIAT